MPDVIVNTSPLQYLFQLSLLELLPSLYGQVIVPEAVVLELNRGREVGCSLPHVEKLAWVTIKQPQHPVLPPLAGGLGAGESAVLALAREIPGAVVVLDDKRARRYARLLGVRLTGILGILLKAKHAGKLTALCPVIEHLEKLGFRFHHDTRNAVLKLAGESVEKPYTK